LLELKRIEKAFVIEGNIAQAEVLHEEAEAERAQSQMDRDYADALAKLIAKQDNELRRFEEEYEHRHQVLAARREKYAASRRNRDEVVRLRCERAGKPRIKEPVRTHPAGLAKNRAAHEQVLLNLVPPNDPEMLHQRREEEIHRTKGRVESQKKYAEQTLAMFRVPEDEFIAAQEQKRNERTVPRKKDIKAVKRADTAQNGTHSNNAATTEDAAEAALSEAGNTQLTDDAEGEEQARAEDGGEVTAGDGNEGAPGDVGEVTAGGDNEILTADRSEVTRIDQGEVAEGDGGEVSAGDQSEATTGDENEATMRDGGEVTAGDESEVAVGDGGEMASGDGGDGVAAHGGEMTAGCDSDVVPWADGDDVPALGEATAQEPALGDVMMSVLGGVIDDNQE
jgi:hypothetical protein